MSPSSFKIQILLDPSYSKKNLSPNLLLTKSYRHQQRWLATAPPATVRASLQVRHLLEGAGGVFTGSRYKDLQIQSLGLWGEIRDWRDGSTIVQKTHDAEGGHVTEVGDCARNERPR